MAIGPAFVYFRVVRMKRFCDGLLLCAMIIGGALLPLFALGTHNSGLPHAPPQESGISVSVQFGEAEPIIPPAPGAPAAPTTGAAVFTGFASPAMLVTLLRNGSVAASQSTNLVGLFEISLTGLAPGIYNFGIFGEDEDGNATDTITLSQTPVFGAAITTLANIFLPPTLVLETTALARDQKIIARGFAYPQSTVNIFFPPADVARKAEVDSDGKWRLELEASLFAPGDYNLHAYAQTFFGLISSLTKLFPFSITIPPPEEIPEIPPEERPPAEERPPEITPEIPPGVPPEAPPQVPFPGLPPARIDLNPEGPDGKIDLLDLSILLYNWGEPKNKKADLNDDGIVDLIDFSILLFWWSPLS